MASMRSLSFIILGAWACLAAAGKLTQADERIARGHGSQTYKFTLDTTSFPQLGQNTWREPNLSNGQPGLIWGDVVRDKDGSISEMVQSSEHLRDVAASQAPRTPVGAFEYCLNLNPEDQRDRIRTALAREEEPENAIFLPLKKSFERLRSYLGATKSRPTEGYAPQVLPFLYEMKNGKQIDMDFWSSSVPPDYDTVSLFSFETVFHHAGFFEAYLFSGRTGKILHVGRDNHDADGRVNNFWPVFRAPLRCVGRRSRN